MSQRARDLYVSTLVWDAHSGFLPTPAADLRNLMIWREAGVDYLSINVGFDLFPWTHTVATFRHWILSHSSDFLLARTAEDITGAKQVGKLAVTFDIEGMSALDGRLEMLQLYHSLGVRQMLFAYNCSNAAGGGCHDKDVGLTEFGRAIVQEMNRLGMFIDLSHCSYRTSMEAMEISSQPVIFSHSNPKALCDHERNITDEQIRACAATGGIIGLVGVSRFLGTSEIDAGILCDQAEHLLKTAGARHVGIGLDYSFPADAEETDAIIQANTRFWPTNRGYSDQRSEYASPGQLLGLTSELLRRGHSEQVIRGVLGENFLRLAEEVWTK